MIAQHAAPKRHRPTLSGGLYLILSACFCWPALAADIQGRVTDEQNTPLAKVPVCLKASTDEKRCSRLRNTDRNGQYRFNGLKEGTTYQVSVFHDDTASGRRLERYRTYVWSPLEQAVSPATKQDSIELPAFTGLFNFSNFQREIVLAATDFPELSSLPLDSDYVVLKVFTAAAQEGSPGDLVFLGRVRNAATLRIIASLPLSAQNIRYQIYGAGFSIDGSISLAES